MKKIVLLFLIAFSVNSFSKDTIISMSETRWNMFKYDFVNIFKGVGYSYARPFHWQGKQWAQFGGVVAIAISVATVESIDNNLDRKYDKK